MKGAYNNIPRTEYEICNVSGRCYTANIEDCSGFETFGADVKVVRQAKCISHKAMAEKINIDWRYLANIENDGAIPSLPIITQLIKAATH